MEQISIPSDLAAQVQQRASRYGSPVEVVRQALAALETVEHATPPEPKARTLDDLIDHEYMARCAAEVAKSKEPPVSLERCREMLSKVSGSLSDDIIADRRGR